jgi:hypothetical protein
LSNSYFNSHLYRNDYTCNAAKVERAVSISLQWFAAEACFCGSTLATVILASA